MTDIRHINNITYSDNKRYVSNSNGSDSFSGKSDIQSKKTLASALTGIGNNTRIEIDYGNYVGGVDINNLYSVDLCGTSVLAKTQTVIGGLNTVTGTSSHVAFKDMNIGSNSADVLCTFSSSGGAHVFENVGSNINLSPVLVQFGTACFSTTVPDLLTNFGKLAARFCQCDFSTAAGQIVLPDLPVGNYACIQIADCVIAGGISIGDGWNVLYNVDCRIGTVTYTGTSTSSQYILTTQIGSDVILQKPILASADMDVDCREWRPETVNMIVALADCEVTLQLCRVMNRRSGDNLSTASGGSGTTYNTSLDLKEGEVFYIYYRSPSEAYYVKLKDPTLIDIATQYYGEYWVSSNSGLPTNHGKSIEAPYQSVPDFLAGWIDFGSRVNIMSGYDHAGNWTLSDQNYITFEGAGKNSMMYGGIELTGVCEHVTFRNLTIANDVTWGGQQAIKFSDVGGKHLLDNLWTDGNTAVYYLEFGVNCFNGVADGITTFGALACTIRDSDLTGSTGVIKLNDLGVGEYAYIKLENTQVSGVEVGDGWYVFYDADSELGTVTYTGAATSSQLIVSTNFPPSGSSTPEMSFKEITSDTTIILGSVDFEVGKTVSVVNTSGASSASIFLDTPGTFYSSSMTADGTTVRLRNGDMVTFYVESTSVAHILNVASQNYPKSAGGIIVGSINGQGFHSELVPSAVDQVLTSSGSFGTVMGAQWQSISSIGYSQHYSNANVNIGAGMFTSMMREFKLSDGNYQSFTLVVDFWQPGSGSTFSSWNFVLEGSLRTDLGVDGVPSFSNLITQSTKWGPLDLENYMNFYFEFSSGYSGDAIQFKSMNLQAIPNGNLSCATRLTLHTRN